MYKYHCLFEQSGTFRDRLRAYGFDAQDYDICNDFGKTDNVIDLFKVIDDSFDKGVSPFFSSEEMRKFVEVSNDAQAL